MVGEVSQKPGLWRRSLRGGEIACGQVSENRSLRKDIQRDGRDDVELQVVLCHLRGRG